MSGMSIIGRETLSTHQAIWSHSIRSRESRLRLGLVGAPSGILFDTSHTMAFEFVNLPSDDQEMTEIDAVVLGWRKQAGAVAMRLRKQGYRGAMIAALGNSHVDNVVSALSCGCDDAQRIPFDPRELAVRVAAIQQRINRSRCAPPIIRAGRLEIGRDGSDPRIDGKPLKVSPNCAKVLAIVAASKHPVPLARIATALYGSEPPPSKTVNTYLCMLRSIMAAATGTDGWLKLSDGGYVLL